MEKIKNFDIESQRVTWTSFAILATFLSKTGCFSGGSTTAIKGHPRKCFWTERLLGFS